MYSPTPGMSVCLSATHSTFDYSKQGTECSLAVGTDPARAFKNNLTCPYFARQSSVDFFLLLRRTVQRCPLRIIGGLGRLTCNRSSDVTVTSSVWLSDAARGKNRLVNGPDSCTCSFNLSGVPLGKHRLQTSDQRACSDGRRRYGTQERRRTCK